MAMLTILATAFVACDKNDSEETPENANVVDLGLTSGTKWAKLNVGAINAWDYGNYYAWGEIKTKSDYSWNSYIYCCGSDSTLTKYCNVASCGNEGFTDAITTLQPADDVASVALGIGYSMPTAADWEELSKQCYWVWVSNYNGQNVNGYIVYKAKSNADKGVKVYKNGTMLTSYSLIDSHIFLPAAGVILGLNFCDDGKFGYYWSAPLVDDQPFKALNCSFGSKDVLTTYKVERCSGLSVRPVYRQ